MNVKILTAVVAVLVLAGCGAAGPESAELEPEYELTEDVEIFGTMTITDALYGHMDDGAECVGANGFDDIRPGTQVNVTVDGKTVGLTGLTDGVVSGSDCLFGFAVNVPRTSEFYGIEVARRGMVLASAEELDTEVLSISLG